MNKLLCFTAHWCSPCKEMQPILDQLDQSRLIRYDVDKAVDERVKYKISAIPTFILIDEQGNELERIRGYTSIESLQNLL